MRSRLLQLLVTISVESGGPSGGIVTELEEVESRLETYPLLRGFLALLNNLCDSTEKPPDSLGAGTRSPGFQPYLEFLINNVLLKLNTRGYKDKAEKVG